jgi:nitrogen fixation protein NifZ
MSRELNTKPVTTVHVVRAAGNRNEERALGSGRNRSLDIGDAVHSLTQVKNDGIYPHKDIGEILVHKGDAGHVRDSWSFLGETYYTVEFAERAAVVIMRGREMERGPKE